MKFSGSKTEKNLLAAFAGESQARNRYSFFASVARKEGYEQIAAVFEDTAQNEREHAKLFFVTSQRRRSRDHRLVPGRRYRDNEGEPESRCRR